MTSNLAGLHRSRLETLLAVEVEYQKKVLALSNQRIQAIKKLLTDADGLHHDPEGDALLLSDQTDPTQVQLPSPTPKKREKKKKAGPPSKAVKVVVGKAPRLIDAIQMVIKNKRMGPKEVHALLKAKNWLPNSKDPLGYIRFTLSDESDIFHRVEGERGIYELDTSNPHYSGKSQAKAPPKEEEVTSEEPSNSGVEEPPPVVDSDLPPAMSDSDSHDVVEAILNGDIPIDS